MICYHVHYESTMTHGPDVGRIIYMIAPIEAESERQAIARCKATRDGSFGHWVNRLANETVSTSGHHVEASGESR